MNYRKMVESHVRNDADVTIGVLRASVDEARHRFGVMEIDSADRVIGFEEKPAEPKPIPGDPRHCYASMGIYVFTTRFLFEQLCQDATRHGSNHDFGGDIIPSIIHSHRVVRPSVSGTRTASRTPTGATSARWTPTTRPTWTSCRSIRS